MDDRLVGRRREIGLRLGEPRLGSAHHVDEPARRGAVGTSGHAGVHDFDPALGRRPGDPLDGLGQDGAVDQDQATAAQAREQAVLAECDREDVVVLGDADADDVGQRTDFAGLRGGLRAAPDELRHGTGAMSKTVVARPGGARWAAMGLP